MIIERMKETCPGETICLSYEECEEVLKLIEDQEERIDIMSEGGWNDADGKAYRDEQIAPNWDDTDKCYCCGKCGKAIVFLWSKEDEFRKTYKYCTSCGQAVKWE